MLANQPTLIMITIIKINISRSVTAHGLIMSMSGSTRILLLIIFWQNLTFFILFSFLVFITDPGPGNIKVTCKDPELMKGMVVHTEHIDRGDIKDKSLVEAHHIPAHTLLKVRLHVGADAPCCAFIGRPVFEGVGHEYDFVDDALDGFDLFNV